MTVRCLIMDDFIGQGLVVYRLIMDGFIGQGLVVYRLIMDDCIGQKLVDIRANLYDIFMISHYSCMLYLHALYRLIIVLWLFDTKLQFSLSLSISLSLSASPSPSLSPITVLMATIDLDYPFHGWIYKNPIVFLLVPLCLGTLCLLILGVP